MAAVKHSVSAWPLGLREDQAAEYVGLSVSMFRREVAARRAPPRVDITRGRIVWLRDDLDIYLNGLADGTPALADWRAAHTMPHALATLDPPVRVINRSPGVPAGPAEEWDLALSGQRDAALS